MEDFKYEINKEYKKVVDLVSNKYKYTDDLKNVLYKILPAMLDTASYEERLLFYKMLSHTPIAILAEGSGETSKTLKEKYIGNPNPHIKEEEQDLGEYGLKEADGAFVTEPVMSEDLQILGTKQFLYVKAFDTTKPLYGVNEKKYELFGTGINVSNLIHELGHAWVSENRPYEIKDGILTQRVGTAELKSKFEKVSDGVYSEQVLSKVGLMIEEGLNTNMEEEALMKYLNITPEKLQKLYKEILIPSNYKGLLSDMTNHLTQKTSKNLINRWRILGDKSASDKLNKAMEKTDEYKNRTEMFKERKRKIELFKNPKSQKLEELFTRRQNEFFPDRTNMSGIEIIDNVLLQCYNIKVNQMFFMGREDGIEYYTDIIGSVTGDGYYLINEASNTLKDLDNQNISK